MSGSTVSSYSYSLDRTVQVILRMQTSNARVTHEQLATKTRLSERHVRRCLRTLREQSVLEWKRDSQWQGSGIRYAYEVKIEVAQTLGYIDQDFLDQLDLTRQRLMAQVS